MIVAERKDICEALFLMSDAYSKGEEPGDIEGPEDVPDETFLKYMRMANVPEDELEEVKKAHHETVVALTISGWDKDVALEMLDAGLL